MAQPANTFTSYSMVGIREDLADWIDNISPDDTPFYSKCGKVSATSTNHEWQTDALEAPADNKHVQGDDTTSTAVTPTVRLGNYSQIFKKAVTIAGTDDGLNKAGRGNEMGYQILKRTKEIKLDMEYAFFANNAKVGGSNSVAGELAGIPAWLTTNTSVGSGGSDPTGDGTDARTDGTTRALTQTLFDTVMQLGWDNGARFDTAYLSSGQMNTALGFVGNNNQRNTVSKDAVSKMMDVYMTPWGQVEFQMSRLVRTRDLIIVQSDKWKVANLRTLKNEPLAKTGDSEKRQLVAELTLECRNEKASGIVADLS